MLFQLKKKEPEIATQEIKETEKSNTSWLSELFFHSSSFLSLRNVLTAILSQGKLQFWQIGINFFKKNPFFFLNQFYECVQNFSWMLRKQRIIFFSTALSKNDLDWDNREDYYSCSSCFHWWKIVEASYFTTQHYGHCDVNDDVSSVKHGQGRGGEHCIPVSPAH